MKKAVVWILILISLVVLLVRFSTKIERVIFGIKPKSGLSVLSAPTGATVFLDNQEVGKTPFEDKGLEVKPYTVRLEKEEGSWQGNVKLTAGTITIVNRDLALDIASSSGEILTLERGKGITLVSNPPEAAVEADGKMYGKTPLTINLTAGEHTIVLSHDNYLKRSIRAILPDKFNLTISVDLALSEADLTTVTAPVITQTPQLMVKETPTGFLRVRDRASLSGKEIAQVRPGDTLILLEELTGWDRVRMSDGTEGFVSSAYVEKKLP